MTEEAKNVTFIEEKGRISLYNNRTDEVICGKITKIKAIRRTDRRRMWISFSISCFLLGAICFSYRIGGMSAQTYCFLSVFLLWVAGYVLFVNDSVPIGLSLMLTSGYSLCLNTIENNVLPEISYTAHKARMEMIQDMQKSSDRQE